MKDFLIKLSRRRRIMVPLVTLVALSIGISGYYIDNQRILREESKSLEQTESENQPNLDEPNLEKAQTKKQEDSSNENNGEDQDSQTANGSTGVQYVVQVSAEEENDGDVAVRGSIEATEPGTCVVSIKKGGFGPEEQIETIGGTCETVFPNPGSGTWRVNVTYTSNDSSLSGSGSTSIDL